MACNSKSQTTIWQAVINIENIKVKNNEFESQKNLACFQNYRTDV